MQHCAHSLNIKVVISYNNFKRIITYLNKHRIKLRCFIKTFNKSKIDFRRFLELQNE